MKRYKIVVRFTCEDVLTKFEGDWGKDRAERLIIDGTASRIWKDMGNQYPKGGFIVIKEQGIISTQR